MSSSKANYGGNRKNKEIDVARLMLIRFWAISLTKNGSNLRRTALRPTSASTAYKKSQAMIEGSEVPQFLGSVDGTDNMDFLADLQTIEVIDPDHKPATSPEDLLEVRVPMLERLGEQLESLGF